MGGGSCVSGLGGAICAELGGARENMPPRPSIGSLQAPLTSTSPCPPSNHTITVNLTITFAASWFGHASHVG